MHEDEIEGVVTPIGLDILGYPISYCIVTDLGEEIEIMDNELFEEIADYENERVVAMGRVKKSPSGALRIWLRGILFL